MTTTHHPATPSRSAGNPGRRVGLLVAAVVALATALFLAPPLLAEHLAGGGANGSEESARSVDQAHLTASFRKAFVDYWAAGRRDFSPGMDRVVDYWFRFHLIKAVIAAILLVVLVVLGLLVRRAFLRTSGPGPGRRAGLASAGALVTLLAAGAAVTVMANIQGAVAPFSSLLPLLPTGTPADGELADTLRQIRERLAAPSGAGEPTPPALDRMIDDFAGYHEAMAVLSAIVLVVLVGIGVALWRTFAATDRADRRTRRLLGWFGVCAALSASAVTVVLVANVGTTSDPRPALAAFFGGGW